VNRPHPRPDPSQATESLPPTFLPLAKGGQRGERRHPPLTRSTRHTQAKTSRAPFLLRPDANCSLTLGSVALSFVSPSHTSLELTPQNVVIVVISLQQPELRMTTFLSASRELKQLLRPYTLANDDAFYSQVEDRHQGGTPRKQLVLEIVSDRRRSQCRLARHGHRLSTRRRLPQHRVFRGSIARHSDSLSTLRRESHPSTTQRVDSEQHGCRPVPFAARLCHSFSASPDDAGDRPDPLVRI
jgi:hypothetical protein